MIERPYGTKGRGLFTRRRWLPMHCGAASPSHQSTSGRSRRPSGKTIAGEEFDVTLLSFIGERRRAWRNPLDPRTPEDRPSLASLSAVPHLPDRPATLRHERQRDHEHFPRRHGPDPQCLRCPTSRLRARPRNRRQTGTVDRRYPRDWRIRRMKTPCGTCTSRARPICLSPEMVTKPPPCFESAVAEETLHLIERRHNERFRPKLDRMTPDWQLRLDQLNRAHFAAEDWGELPSSPGRVPR